MLPSPAAKTDSPFFLIYGDDDFNVGLRAKAVYEAWCKELGGMDHEIITATANNSDDALKSLRKLREALNTLPFFGGGKAIWFRDCNFLGEERTAESEVVTDFLDSLGKELKTFRWQNVRLVISAAKVNRVRSFYKTIDKLATVENFAALTLDSRDWEDAATGHALKEVAARGKNISDAALEQLVMFVGPNLRQLTNEIEKLTLFLGGRKDIEARDVQQIVSRNKQARAFALGDAVGDRDLPKFLKTLDEEIWAMNYDKKKSEVGMLYGLISKVRAMLFMKAVIRDGLMKPVRDPKAFYSFKPQLDRLSAELMGEDKKFSPLGMNPYVLFSAARQAENYSLEELVRALDLLLQCNLKLVSSGVDEVLLLQQALIAIIGPSANHPRRPAPQVRFQPSSP